VLICDDGRCVLTDFGVARLPTESKLTTPGMVLGSPHFISPERAVGGAFGPPSDLFSLGVTLYTAIEGGPPFDRGDPFETMRAVVEEAPRPARLAGPLKPVLWGLLEKEPERRWTVDQSRIALRDLLTGALAPARRAAPRSSVRETTDTDPGAVIRPPASPPPAIRNSGVGGRAMLDPSEPIADQVARLRESAGLPAEDATRLSMDDVTRTIPTTDRPPTGGRVGDGRVADAGPREVWWDSPSRADRPSWAGGASWSEAGQGDEAQGGRTSHRGAGTASRSRWSDTTARQHVGRRRAPSRSSQLSARVGTELRTLGREIGARRNRSRVIVGAGLLTILLVVAIAALAGAFGGDGSGTTPPPDTAASAGATPLIDVQEFRERGMAVNVPATWTRGGANSYVDYNDPDSPRWVRINIEPVTTSAMDLLQAAGERLNDPSVCAAPYTQMNLAEAPLAGLAGAELEYTCGEGAEKRHGIWRAVVRDGTAFHFYLTALDADFAASRIIYDEMIRSFQFV
jgi:eukaryotic-like serine/threonine-protein kinase